MVYKKQKPLKHRLLRAVVLAASLLLASLLAQAQAVSESSSGEVKGSPAETRMAKKRAVSLTRFNHQPLIDGNLDDEIWQQAAVLKDFLQTQPGDNIPPSYATEIRMGYDGKYLFAAHDITFKEIGKCQNSRTSSTN